MTKSRVAATQQQHVLAVCRMHYPRCKMNGEETGRNVGVGPGVPRHGPEASDLHSLEAAIGDSHGLVSH
jgi:hypothetical protein